MIKKLTFLIPIILITANSFAQGHFVVAFTGNGQDHMNIFLVSAAIGGVALEAGDEVAAFDGAICCGKVILTQPININDNKTFTDIKASRKDDGQSNGYTIKNTITYKFWDSSKNMEISGITAEYFNPSTDLPTHAPTYSISGSAFVKLSVATPVNYTLDSDTELDQSEVITGIDPFANDTEIKIYPNPTRGNVQLKFAHIPNAETWITTYDVSGKLIHRTLAVNKEEQINLNGNPSGLYFINIEQKIPKTYKIILE